MLSKATAVAGLLTLAACATPQPQTVANLEPVICPKLEANAEFSCWWSNNTAPLSHCVLVRDNNPGCGIPARAIAYFNRGVIFDRGIDHDRPNGTWTIATIYEDEQGRIGQLLLTENGKYLDVDRQAAAASKHTTPTNPIWPRWPSGYEGGPEQVR